MGRREDEFETVGYPTSALRIYPGDVARDRSGGDFKPFGDLRLRYFVPNNPGQPGQCRSVQLVRPAAQLAPGPNLGAAVALCSCRAAPLAHLVGGDWLSLMCRSLSQERDGCQVISLRHVMSDTGPYVNYQAALQEAETQTAKEPRDTFALKLQCYFLILGSNGYSYVDSIWRCVTSG
jgi:hypothetical protein